MPIVIESPHRYNERILVFGHEGSGKSSTLHNIIKHTRRAHGFVIDLDYSYAHDRLLAEEYEEIEDRMHIYTVEPEWEAFMDTIKRVKAEADPERGDWWMIDPTTITWQLAQSWYSDQVHGEELADMMIGLRAKQQAAKDAASNKNDKDKADKQYAKELAEDMTWPIINKIYEKFYKELHRWHGHFILVCEADALRNNASESEKDQYGFIGQKPKGQKGLPYVAATNIYLAHPKRDLWTMTTVKDRGRKLVEKEEVEDFALDYLVGIGKWKQTVVK